MRKNKKLILISSILATTAIAVVPAISIVNNTNTVNVIDSQLDNVVQNSQQVEMDIIDSNINAIEDNNQVKDVGDTFVVGAEELMAAGWGTNITGDLLFTVLDDVAGTVSVKAQSPVLFAATDFNIQGSIRNANNVATYNVTKIANNAFGNCPSLTGTLTIPTSVTSIGVRAFYSCSKLNDLNLINATSLTDIGDSAFNKCTGLIGDLTIPASLTTIGDSAFFGNKFTSIVISSGNTAFAKADNVGNNCYAILKNGASAKFDFSQTAASQIVGGLLCGEIEIPVNVTSIGDNAFEKCSGLSGVAIPASVTSIGSNAFAYCSGLTGTLTIPASVTSIGDMAFSDCSGLTGNLVIPSKVSSIGNSVFLGCSGLTGALTIPASVTSIGEGAFGYCKFTSIDIDIGNKKYCKATNLGTNCNAIMDISTKGIFENGSNIVGGLACGELVLPNDIETIGEMAFAACSGLTGTLTIPASVTTIGNGAFYLTGLTSVTIGSKVTAIGEWAFVGANLLNINVSNETPPAISKNSFEGIYDISVLHILPGTKAAYTTDLNWNQFKNIIDDYIPFAPTNDSNLGAIIGGTLGGLAGAAAIAGGTTYYIKRNKKTKKNKMGGVPPTTNTPSDVTPTTNTPSDVTPTTNTPSFEQK